MGLASDLHVLASCQLRVRITAALPAVDGGDVVEEAAALGRAVLRAIHSCRFVEVAESVHDGRASQCPYERWLHVITMAVIPSPADYEHWLPVIAGSPARLAPIECVGRHLCSQWTKCCGADDQLYKWAPRLELLNAAACFATPLPEHGCETESPADGVGYIQLSGVTFGNVPHYGSFVYRRLVNDQLASPGDFGCCALTAVAHFEHDVKKLTVMFIERHDGGGRFVYKMVIEYGAIETALVDLASCDGGSGAPYERFVFLHLRHPPEMWLSVDELVGEWPQSAFLCDNWVRVGRLWPSPVQGSTDDFAQCPWVAFALPHTVTGVLGDLGCGNDAASAQRRAERVHDVLLDRNRPSSEPVLFEIAGRLISRVRLRVAFGRRLHFEPPRPAGSVAYEKLDSFRANYAFMALLTRGFAVTDLLDQAFVRACTAAVRQCRQAAEDALDMLLAAVDEQRYVVPLDAFNYLYEQQLSQRQDDDDTAAGGSNACAATLPKHCALVRKVVVTPSRLVLLPAEPLLLCRVLRAFGADRSLRLVFRDDNGRKFSFGPYSA